MRKLVAPLIVAGIVATGLFGMLGGGSALATYACPSLPDPLVMCYVVGEGSGGAAAAVGKDGGWYAQGEAKYFKQTGAFFANANGKFTGALLFCEYQTGKYWVVYGVNSSVNNPKYLKTSLNC